MISQVCDATVLLWTKAEVIAVSSLATDLTQMQQQPGTWLCTFACLPSHVGSGLPFSSLVDELIRQMTYEACGKWLG